MGISFYNCEKCGDTIVDCGPYTSCEGCGYKFCVNCVKPIDWRLFYNDKMTEGEQIEGENAYYDAISKACPVCTGETITDSQILSFLLHKAGLTRGQVEKKIRDGA